MNDERRVSGVVRLPNPSLVPLVPASVDIETTR